ncbi:MAG TPA: hypothetical protein VN706_04940 [Gemmatimonadaceae bacterium]|nr:hypothetical protein [Gemmatimonadaceae bacterium]
MASFIARLGFGILASTSAAHQAAAQAPVASGHGYAFVFTNDSSAAVSATRPGYRMWIRAIPGLTRIQFSGDSVPDPTPAYSIVDGKTRIAYVPAKEHVLEGSIDAYGGAMGALAWPPEHTDQYREIELHDVVVSNTDSLLGRRAEHRRYSLAYLEWNVRQREQADCWYVELPATLRDAVDHAAHFFGISKIVPRNRLESAIWAVSARTPVKCTYERLYDGGAQYGIRTTHETWSVSDVRTRDFEAPEFAIPALPRVRSPYKPGVLNP